MRQNQEKTHKQEFDPNSHVKCNEQQQAWNNEQMQNTQPQPVTQNVEPSDRQPNFVSNPPQNWYSPQTVSMAHQFQHQIPQYQAINTEQQERFNVEQNAALNNTVGLHQHRCPRVPSDQQQRAVEQTLDSEYTEARRRTLEAMRRLTVTHFMQLQNSPESIEAELFNVSPSMSDYLVNTELFICNLKLDLDRKLREVGRRPNTKLQQAAEAQACVGISQSAEEETRKEPSRRTKRSKKISAEDVVPEDLREWKQYYYIESIIPIMVKFVEMADKGIIKGLKGDIVARTIEIVRKFKERSPIEAMDLDRIRRFVWAELIPMMAEHRVPYEGPRENLNPAQMDYVTMLHIVGRKKDEKQKDERPMEAATGTMDNECDKVVER
ncbi:hypothetical protein ACOME3_004781 [Neoechinorhynchus agilis]